MSKKTAWVCDGCGKQEPSNGLPARWCELSYYSHGVQHRYHFCGFECAGKWCDKKVKFFAEQDSYIVTAFEKGGAMMDCTWTPSVGDAVKLVWLDICGQSDDLLAHKTGTLEPMEFFTWGTVIEVSDKTIKLASSQNYDPDEARFMYRDSLAVPRSVVIQLIKLKEEL